MLVGEEPKLSATKTVSWLKLWPIAALFLVHGLSAVPRKGTAGRRQCASRTAGVLLSIACKSAGIFYQSDAEKLIHLLKSNLK